MKTEKNVGGVNQTVMNAIMLIFTCVLVCLKVCGIADISWLWVLAPVWMPIAVGLCILIAVLLVVTVVFAIRKFNRRH